MAIAIPKATDDALLIEDTGRYLSSGPTISAQAIVAVSATNTIASGSVSLSTLIPSRMLITNQYLSAFRCRT